MQYIKVYWIHRNPDEPVLLISELDSLRKETRKIEIYKDGQKGFADKLESGGSTRLGIEPIPDLEVIASDIQFKPETISKEEFEMEWTNRRSQSPSKLN